MQILRRIAAAFALAGGIGIAAIVLVTTANILLFAAHRAAVPFGGQVSGLPGYEDFVRLAVSAAALMFFPQAQAARGHVAVEIFAERLPAGLGRALDRLWLALTALLALFLAGWMVAGMAETRADGIVSPILGWPEWPFYLPGIAALLLWAAVAGAQAAFEPEAAGDRRDV